MLSNAHLCFEDDVSLMSQRIPLLDGWGVCVCVSQVDIFPRKTFAYAQNNNIINKALVDIFETVYAQEMCTQFSG